MVANSTFSCDSSSEIFSCLKKKKKMKNQLKIRLGQIQWSNSQFDFWSIQGNIICKIHVTIFLRAIVNLISKYLVKVKVLFQIYISFSIEIEMAL